MRMKLVLVIMLTALLLVAAPLAADDAPAKKVDKKEAYRKAILAHAKLDINVFKEQLKGGLADGKAVTDFPLEQLIAGMLAEKKHTDNPMLALELAMDNLAGHECYYRHARRMGHRYGCKMGKGMHMHRRQAKHKCNGEHRKDNDCKDKKMHKDHKCAHEADHKCDGKHHGNHACDSKCGGEQHKKTECAAQKDAKKPAAHCKDKASACATEKKEKTRK